MCIAHEAFRVEDIWTGRLSLCSSGHVMSSGVPAPWLIPVFFVVGMFFVCNQVGVNGDFFHIHTSLLQPEESTAPACLCMSLQFFWAKWETLETLCCSGPCFVLLSCLWHFATPSRLLSFLSLEGSSRIFCRSMPRVPSSSHSQPSRWLWSLGSEQYLGWGKSDDCKFVQSKRLLCGNGSLSVTQHV